MGPKLLIYLSSASVSAAVTRSGRVSAITHFDNDEAGVAEFRSRLGEWKGLPAFVLVDATEEDYRFETLPHASGADRQQMVARKLRQHYRGSPFTSALLVGRDNTKRRDDRFLFCALTNAEIVTPWLDCLTAADQPVGGVFLLPMVLPQLVTGIQEKSHNLLIVDALPTGIRLSFFKDGSFRLSRLSRVDGTADLAKAVHDEVGNTRLYLHALRAATLDEQVTVLLLDTGNRLEQAAQTITADNPSLSCTRMTELDIAAKLRFDAGTLQQHPETLYLLLLARRLPASNLASPAVTTLFRRLQNRQRLFITSAVTAAIGLLWTGGNLYRQFELDAERDSTVQRTTRVNAEYEAATRQFPSAPTSADNLRRTTELADRLAAAGHTPENMMRLISRALEADPGLSLRQLEWQYAPNDIAGATSTAYGPASAASPPAPGAPPLLGNKRKESAAISGEVRDASANYRDAISRINNLVERLRAEPSVGEVRIVQLPLNVSPGLTLSGSTSETVARAGNNEFRVVVIMKAPT